MQRPPEPAAELPWTGERFIPTLEGDIRLEHVHRYLLARELAKGKDVLDIACGEGYGSDMLAAVAVSVVGVDIANAAIAHAKKTYQRKNLDFKVGSCAEIPLEDASVDLVVSFETIEHHDQHEEMALEINHPDLSVRRQCDLLGIEDPPYGDSFSTKQFCHQKVSMLNFFPTDSVEEAIN